MLFNNFIRSKPILFTLVAQRSVQPCWRPSKQSHNNAVGPIGCTQRSIRILASTFTQGAVLPLSESDQHNFWRNYFHNYMPEDEATQNQRMQDFNKLKEDVRKMLLDTFAFKSELEQLEFIDDIQRLGVGYHFENEIGQALNKIYQVNHLEANKTCHGLKLYHVSLMFRLLRQHFIPVSSDVFKQFLGENGEFDASLGSDLESTLSLYEASHLRACEDHILDNAVTLATAQLKLIKSRLTAADNHYLAMKVAYALDRPLYKGVPRVESRRNISLYEVKPSHDKILLKFAKLDYNFVQSLHKKELGDLFRWWSSFNVFTRIPYKLRDVIVEIYFCCLATLDERPQYSDGRIILSKLLVAGIMIDDLYDECDIIDLELLTKALQRWDKGCINQLPEHLQAAYSIYMDVHDEVKQYLAKEGREHTFQYMIEACKFSWKWHLQATKLCRGRSFPTFEEYMNTTSPNIYIMYMVVGGILGMGITEREVYQWALQYPREIDVASKMVRLWDDIGEDDLMKMDDKPTAVSCYMKEHNITNKEQAYEELRKMIDDSWKVVNQAMLEVKFVPMAARRSLLGQPRFNNVLFYGEGDGFTDSYNTPMKETLDLLFKDPIPM